MSAALGALGIHLRDHRAGQHRASCPECRASKVRAGDTALAVLVDVDGGATWLCHRCGWRGAVAADRQHHEWRPPRPAAPEPEAVEARHRAGIAATALWRSTLPITADCVAGRYLLNRRCWLPHPDGDLRFLEQHRHPCGHVGPCMIGLITNALTGAPMSLHMTWIREDGTKTPIASPRLNWKHLPKLGGVVRLWPDAEITLGLCVAEGIETALTAARAFGLAWATIDKGNLKTLPVLALDALTIVADADPDRGGQAAAETCARRWAAAGIEVFVWPGLEDGQDFNDFARSAA